MPIFVITPVFLLLKTAWELNLMQSRFWCIVQLRINTYVS